MVSDLVRSRRGREKNSSYSPFPGTFFREYQAFCIYPNLFGMTLFRLSSGTLQIKQRQVLDKKEFLYKRLVRVREDAYDDDY